MIYEIRIVLKESNPEIWRQIKINPNISLNDLHKIIQTAMGWMNSHLHQFIKGRTTYGNPDNDEFGDMDYEDSRKFRVTDVLKSTGNSITYEYDFGDGWEHDIELIKIDKDKDLIHPICIDGARSCPLEDSGGIWGYQEKLEIMKDKKHEEYEEIVEWMGLDFDPNHFDLNETNKMLTEKDYGCIEMMY